MLLEENLQMNTIRFEAWPLHKNLKDTYGDVIYEDEWYGRR